MEVLIALMICWVEYVFQIKQDVNLNVFNMIRINGSETLIEHIYANVNVNLMEANVIQIKSRMKNWIFKIYYFKSIIGDSIVTYTEILDTVAKSYYQLTNFKQKKANL